jgi:hypothetical protein
MPSRYRGSERGGIHVGQNDERLGLRQKQHTQHLLQSFGVGFRRWDKQNHLVANVESFNRLCCLSATHENRAGADWVFRYYASLKAGRIGEARRFLSTSGRKNYPGLPRLEPSPGYRVALNGCLKAKAPKQCRDILRRELQTPAGRIPAQHRIICDDANPPGYIHGCDGPCGLHRRLGCLGLSAADWQSLPHEDGEKARTPHAKS